MGASIKTKDHAKDSAGVIVGGKVQGRSSERSALPKRASEIKALKAGGIDGVASIRKLRSK
jgi:hypothetical protein